MFDNFSHSIKSFFQFGDILKAILLYMVQKLKHLLIILKEILIMEILKKHLMI